MTQVAAPATAGASTPAGSWAGDRARAGSASTPGRRRRRAPYLVLGLLLVVVCTTASVLVTLRLGNRMPVLVLARPVTVGQVLAAQDLRTASVAVDAGVRVVRAGEATSVVGQTMAVSLPAGVMLTREAVGTPIDPGAGQAIAALVLKPGQVPPGTAPGVPVVVVLTAEADTGQSTGQTWPATVAGLGDAVTGQDTVVSVRLAEDDARQIATVPPGQLSLVIVSEWGS